MYSKKFLKQPRANTTSSELVRSPKPSTSTKEKEHTSLTSTSSTYNISLTLNPVSQHPEPLFAPSHHGRHAPEDFQTVRGDELAEDRARQCAVEVLHPFYIFQVFFGGKYWVTILRVVLVDYENEEVSFLYVGK